jgi:hypothetical protein
MKETLVLKEAAKKYKDLWLPDDHYDAFIAGAKWQAERMYTEEQVREALFYALNVNRTTCCTTRTTDSIVRESIQSLKQK